MGSYIYIGNTLQQGLAAAVVDYSNLSIHYSQNKKTKTNHYSDRFHIWNLTPQRKIQTTVNGDFMWVNFHSSNITVSTASTASNKTGN